MSLLSQQPVQPYQPDCPPTTLHLWTQPTTFEPMEPDYLNQIYPMQLNCDTMESGVGFIFHILGLSLGMWVELAEGMEPNSETADKAEDKHEIKADNHPEEHSKMNKPLMTPKLEKMHNSPQKEDKRQCNQTIEDANTTNSKSQLDSQNVNDANNQASKQIETATPTEKQIRPKLSKKDSKFIGQLLRTDEGENSIAFRRWCQAYDREDWFMRQLENESKYQVPEGKIVRVYSRKEQKFEVRKYFGDDKSFLAYRNRIQILFLFYIDGVSFIPDETSFWEYYVIYKRQGIRPAAFVGALSKYVFKLSSTRERHRVSQVFVMPPYQSQGHGKELLDLVYGESLAYDQCFEITTEIPSFEFQCLRDFKELQLVLQAKLVPFMSYQNLPQIRSQRQVTQCKQILLSKDIIRRTKEGLKLPGHQIQRLAQILIYWSVLNRSENDFMRAHFEQSVRNRLTINMSAFKSRKMMPHITIRCKTFDLKDFLRIKAKEDLIVNPDNVTDLLTETLEGYRRVILKLKKVGLLS